MSARIAFVVFACAAAFFGAYAMREADGGSDSGAARPAAATVAAGETAPVSRAIPVPAVARLPGLREGPAGSAPRRSSVAVRRARAPSVAVNSAPAPAPAAPRAKPKPDPGTPFFDAE